MVEVYFYIPARQTDMAVECGIKVSDWYTREVLLDGAKKKCIAALLNPRDDFDKYMSPAYRCLKLEVKPKYCFVADSLLYEVGLAYPEVMEMYQRSMMPVEQYTFGGYRLPECLVTSTVLGEDVHLLGKGLESPVLYDNCQELYFNNILEGFRETHDDFNDTLLYHFFRRLCDEGKAVRVEDTISGLAVFTYNGDGRVYTLRIPDMGAY